MINAHQKFGLFEFCKGIKIETHHNNLRMFCSFYRRSEKRKLPEKVIRVRHFQTAYQSKKFTNRDFVPVYLSITRSVPPVWEGSNLY